MRPIVPEILLIDNRTDITNLFERALFLSKMPARLTLAADAPDAITRLTGMGRYDGQPLPAVVVLTHDLPGVKGATLLHIIRRTFPDDVLPVVMLIDASAACPPDECATLGHAVCATIPTTMPMMMDLIDTLHRLVPPPHEILMDECLASPYESLPAGTWTEDDDVPGTGGRMPLTAGVSRGAPTRSRTLDHDTWWGRGDAGIEWPSDASALDPSHG